MVISLHHLRQNIYIFTISQETSRHSQWPFQCNYCAKTFNRISHLQYHQESHGNKIGKYFCCDGCGKSFVTKSYLKRHKISHTVNQHFDCKECDKSFLQAGSLRRHQTIHTGRAAKTFSCKYCPKIFKI